MKMVAQNLQDLRQITPNDLSSLGMNDIAYVLAKQVSGREVFAIHTADGNEVAVVETHDLAIATILQNDLEIVQVH
jgi:hypothetical protein